MIPGAAAPSDALSQQAFQSLQKYFAAYPRSLNNDVYLGKVDLFLTSAQRLSVRYNANRFTGVNYENSGATSAAGHTGNSSVTTDNVSGSHTLVISGATVLDSRVTYTRDNEPGAGQLDRSGSRHPAGRRHGDQHRPQQLQPAVYQRPHLSMGGQPVSRARPPYVQGRAGYQLPAHRQLLPGQFQRLLHLQQLRRFRIQPAVQLHAGVCGFRNRRPLSTPNVNEYAFYAQDSWRVSEQLTLNYGIRYDLFQPGQPEG